MLKKILPCLLISLYACGTAGAPGRNGTNGKDGINGTNGIDGKNGVDGKDFTPEQEVSLAGYHLLPNGGYLELLEDSDGRLIINGTQRIYTKNSDNSLSLLPTLGTGPYAPHDGILRIESNLTYAAATHNMQPDANNTAMVGSRKTVVTLTMKDKKFVVDVLVYSSTGLVIESTRKATEE